MTKMNRIGRNRRKIDRIRPSGLSRIEWTKYDQNGQIRTKVDCIGSKWTEWTENGQMDYIGSKWTEDEQID